METNITNQIIEELLCAGAELVGVGDLKDVPSDARQGLPFGICVAVKYPSEVIRKIADMPTKEYFDWYNTLNNKLDDLVTQGAGTLQQLGYTAIAQTRAQVGTGETELCTTLPHKTVATRAGIGWIGKSALLINKGYGSMIRISSILTDAPLEAATPINKSYCGDCMICTEACPAGAVSGKCWELGLQRDEFFNAEECRQTALERAQQGAGVDYTICGKCIAVCPHTKKAWE